MGHPSAPSRAQGTQPRTPRFGTSRAVWSNFALPTDSGTSPADGWITSDDACPGNPPTPIHELTDFPLALQDSIQSWFDFCLPKSKSCGASDDNCSNVVFALFRPELRCAVRDCLLLPCGELNTCLEKVMQGYPTCFH